MFRCKKRFEFGMQMALIVLMIISCVGVCRGIYQTEIWPSPDEVFALNDRLDGDLYLPGVEEYANSSYVRLQPMWSSSLGCVLYAESLNDIKEGLAFTRNHKIQPTIRSSGHCFLGRSSGDQTFLINLERMKYMSVSLDDLESDTGASITVQTGIEWRSIYEEAHKYSHMVVGGSSPTVTPGGYLLGGGHSPITRSYGLGSDNVLKIWAVLADGSYITLMDPEKGDTHIEYPNGTAGVMDIVHATELWWGLRGGGLTVAVVYQWKLKMHPEKKGGLTQAYINCPMEHPLHGNVGYPILNNMGQFIALNMTSSWGGSLMTGGLEYEDPDTGTFKGYIITTLLHLGSYEEAVETIKPVYDFHPEYCFERALIHYDTLWDYQKNVSYSVSERLHLLTRFIHKEDFLDPAKHTAVILENAKRGPGYVCNGVLTGGVTASLKVESAVSPDFRHALTSLTCSAIWTDPEDDEHYIQSQLKFGEEHFYKMGHGVYFNEADYYMENWKTEYWGSMENYERLLKMKNNFDPEHMFWCHHCVGSDTGPITKS